MRLSSASLEFSPFSVSSPAFLMRLDSTRTTTWMRTS